MGQQKNQVQIRKIRRGQPITARYLNDMGAAINRNTIAISGPRNRNRESLAGAGGGTGLTDLLFTETSRSETTVTVTDSNGDTHNVNQIDTVELTNSAGDVLTLVFDNS